MNRSFLKQKQPPGNALQLDLFIDRGEIEEKLLYMAKEIEALYKGKELTIMMIMKGSFFLVADLMRILHLPAQVESLDCSSYGQHGAYKGDLQVSSVKNLAAKEKHILIVDDIFDTGETITEVYEQLKQEKPLSIRSLVLLTKDVPHNTDYRPDYSLFDIEDRFVVGYGLDYKGYYRGLPDIYSINP